MAWLDDRIQNHPKLVDLSDRAFRAWINTLCYCSMHGTGGRLDAAIKAHRIPKTVARELIRAEIWDEEDGELWVHDWQEHNEKRDQSREEKRALARERQRKHREKVRLSRVTERDSHALRHADVTQPVTRDESVTALAGARAPRARDHDQGEDLDQEPSFAVDAARDPNGTQPTTEQQTIEEQEDPDDPEPTVSTLPNLETVLKDMPA